MTEFGASIHDAQKVSEKTEANYFGIVWVGLIAPSTYAAKTMCPT